MSDQRRRIWPLVGLFGLVVLGLAIAYYVLIAKKTADAVSVVAGVVGVLAITAHLVQWLLKALRNTGPPPDKVVNSAADCLAEQVDVQWSEAAGDRGLLAPVPMPVQWHWCEGVTNRPADAVGSSRFEPLPGIPPASTEIIQAGELTDLRKVFGGLASGRIVIVGGPGSGKSAAAILLLLDVLKYRLGVGPNERARVPVPVLFTLRGWDPETQLVRDWLSRELTRTYPFLAAYGRAVREKLISSKRLAFFLDGLDELPQALRAPALKALSTQATSRVLILSRSKEMAGAVGGGFLVGAAALELEPIPASVAAEYLDRTQCGPLPGPWQRLVDYLRAQPDSVVSAALSSPLMVSLVRDTYGAGENPAELLDAARLGTAADVEHHLLDRVLPAAYARRPGEAPPRYSLDAATRGLGYIAARMNRDNHRRDLAWWQVTDWVPKAPLIITTSLLFGVVCGLLFGFAHGPVVGLAAALVAVVLEALGQAGFLEPLGPPKRLGTVQRRAMLSPKSLRAAPALGVAFGTMEWIVGGPGIGLLFGLLGGLATWLVLGLGRSGAEQAPSKPLDSWRSDRNYGLAVGIPVGLVAGVGLGLALGIGFVGGFVIALVIGLVVGLFYPNTWRTAVACGQLRLSGHTPFRLIRFLEDAYARNVLRTVGPIYQFRHASLQDHLAMKWVEGQSRMSEDTTGELADVKTVGDYLNGSHEGTRLGLVVQGGAMRGVYSMGALTALEDAGLRDAFDIIVGSSGGAINGAYFLAGQAAGAVQVYIEHLSNRNFVNFLRLQKMVDIDYLVDVVMKQHLPLKMEVLRNSPTLLEVVVANAENGEAEVITNRDTGYDFYEVMRATSALPGLYNKKVRLGSHLYVDGGTVDSIPIARAVQDGSDQVLAIVTRRPGYRRVTRGWLYRLVARLLARGQTAAIRDRMGRADPILNQAMITLEGEGASQFRGWCVWPDESSELVSRTTTNKYRLMKCADMGRRDMERLLKCPLQE